MTFLTFLILLWFLWITGWAHDAVTDIRWAWIRRRMRRDGRRLVKVHYPDHP